MSEAHAVLPAVLLCATTPCGDVSVAQLAAKEQTHLLLIHSFIFVAHAMAFQLDQLSGSVLLPETFGVLCTFSPLSDPRSKADPAARDGAAWWCCVPG